MFKKTDILFYQEVCSLTFIITAGVSLITIVVKLTTFSELIFASQNILTSLSLIFLYLLPPILTTVLPISVFTASAIVALRMSTDKEYDALFSCGMSIKQALYAPFILGVITAILMLINTLYYEPYSKKQFQMFKWFQARQLVESFFIKNIKEKSFISNFPLIDNNKVFFYSDSISKSQIISNIFIAIKNTETKNNTIFVAKTGRFFKTFSNQHPDFIFSLSDGMIHSDNGITTKFGKLNFSILNFIESNFKSDAPKNDTNISFFSDLKPISAALCTLSFPALGVCLSLFNIHNKPFKIYFGIGLVILVFYSLLTLCRMITIKYGISPFLMFSIPPFVFGCLTVTLAYRSQTR